MNETAQSIRSDQPQNPQYEKDDGNSNKHNIVLSFNYLLSNSSSPKKSNNRIIIKKAIHVPGVI